MFVPCVDYCFNRLGKQYSPEDCDETCDYAMTVKILKEVLIQDSGCHYCKRYDICTTGECIDFEKYELDLDSIKDEYEI